MTELLIYGFTVHARYRANRSGKVEPVAAVDLHAPPHSSCIASASNYLQLSTSRHTNIVPRALTKLPGAAAVGTAVHAAAVPLRAEFMRHPIYMQPGDLWSIPRLGEFDLVCLVLWCRDDGEADQSQQQQQQPRGGGARWQRRRRMLCVGLSGAMLLVELTESKETLFFGAAPPTPQLMIIENLAYQRYEKKLHLHTASATAITIFKPKGLVQLATLEQGTLVAPVANPPSSHAVFAHPSLLNFHAWLLQPSSALLWNVINELSLRMIDGRWNGDQASSFNKDEFGSVREKIEETGGKMSSDSEVQ